MGLAVYPRASFALGVEGSFACACTANVPGAGMGARDVGSGIGHRRASAIAGESAIGTRPYIEMDICCDMRGWGVDYGG